ncbi:MAG: hypothetical protein ABI581_11435 [Sediminibacterium sp.]
MKTNNTKWLAWTGLAFIAITIVAWKSNDTIPARSQPRQSGEDTTPTSKKVYSRKDRDYRVGDLDKAMRELDQVMVEMNNNMKIDFNKMDKEMKLAMDELKKVDFEKISHDVATSLKSIDWDKTKVEVEKAMREVDMKLKEVDMTKIKKEIEKAQESVNAAKISSHIDMNKIKESVEKGLEGAREGIARAKKELALLKEFTETLEKDGLISKKKGYKIEIKDGEMYINGTKQSKEVNDKYRKYFKEDDYTLRSDGEGISSI